MRVYYGRTVTCNTPSFMRVYYGRTVTCNTPSFMRVDGRMIKINRRYSSNATHLKNIHFLLIAL
jgi:hypothetical protein